ncbi:coiled-coil domain-containing protein 9B isoform X2 [Gouania willdenowi]|uniref:Coiled-coil domain containing 9B n=1 Tax=Gouania willdenowi TaxID=441366 RepID=A0A8C5H0A7_GOUWI|nr:coiled-coil domain-containing protein 9B isoform X2 [Gouania willdenowi]
MDRSTSSDGMSKRDHERDLELDKKIEALRRKNEALMKRYKEVEEDRKRAEEEGMPLQSRKGKADDLTITISKSTSESRVVVTKQLNSGSPTEKGKEHVDKCKEGATQGAGRGHRKQLMITMVGKKGKRVVSERLEKSSGSAEVPNSSADDRTRCLESPGNERQRTHIIKGNTAAQNEDKPVQKDNEEHQYQESDESQLKKLVPESPQASTDLNIPTSKEEQDQYLLWKKEREQIDRERVARHKNAKGQWRRAWDMDKNEKMFLDKSVPDRDWGPSGRGGRTSKRGQHRGGGETRGQDKRSKNKEVKNVPVVSSKAKGIERLTGRARRWESDNDEKDLEITNSTLEEFLEELDALTENVEDQDTKRKLSSSPNSHSTPEEVPAVILRKDTPIQSVTPVNSSPRSLEKKVRFSVELIQGAHVRQTGSSPVSLSPDSSFLKVEESQQRVMRATPGESDPHDEGGGPSGPSSTPAAETDSRHHKAPSSSGKASAHVCESSARPIDHSKFSSTNTEELIDSGLSVLSLESGNTHAAHSTSSDKAREHGKIV